MHPAQKQQYQAAENKLVGIDNYERLHELGQGCFGVVWKARDKTFGQIVAIKQVAVSRGQGPGKQEEHVLQSKVLHRNVNRMIACYEKKGVYSGETITYIVMECCEIPNLSKIILSNRNKPTEQEFKALALTLLNGIQAIHENGICHRDLKPSNIGFGLHTFQLKILDFGLSRFIPDNNLMRSHAGSIAFMSPQIIKQQKYSAKTDIWSYGAILYYIASGGTLAFDMGDQNSFKKNVIDDRLETDLIKHLSEEAQQLIRSCLSQSEEKRPQAVQLLELPYFAEYRDNLKGADSQVYEYFVKRARFILDHQILNSIQSKIDSASKFSDYMMQSQNAVIDKGAFCRLLIELKTARLEEIVVLVNNKKHTLSLRNQSTSSNSRDGTWKDQAKLIQEFCACILAGGATENSMLLGTLIRALLSLMTKVSLSVEANFEYALDEGALIKMFQENNKNSGIIQPLLEMKKAEEQYLSRFADFSKICKCLVDRINKQ